MSKPMENPGKSRFYQSEANCENEEMKKTPWF